MDNLPKFASYVKLHYGPYESNGIIRHKTQRLHGLLGLTNNLQKKRFHISILEVLNENGFLVELIHSPHINRLTVEMFDRIIFTCDIRNLCFNMSAKDDEVCQRIIHAIKLHYELFGKETNITPYVDIREGMRWLNKPHVISPKDPFNTDVSLIYEIGNPHNSLQSYIEEASGGKTISDSSDSCQDLPYDTDIEKESAFGVDFSNIFSDYGEITEKDSSECLCLEIAPPTQYTVCFDHSCPPKLD